MFNYSARRLWGHKGWVCFSDHIPFVKAIVPEFEFAADKFKKKFRIDIGVADQADMEISRNLAQR